MDKPIKYLIAEVRPCRSCDGRGELDGSTCLGCNGTGTRLVRTDIEVEQRFLVYDEYGNAVVLSGSWWREVPE